MDTITEAMLKIIDKINALDKKIQELQAVERPDFTSGRVFPANPKNGQVFEDKSVSHGQIWAYDSAISRWTSPTHLFMPLGFSQVGTLVTSPNTVQVHVQQLPLNFDVYIFSLQTFWAVGATNDASNYWTVSNDFGASKTSITVDGNKEFRADLPVNQVITARDKIRTVVGPTGYPSGLYVYGALMEYLLLK